MEKVLAGLGFPAADLEKRPAELSGGFQVRLNLAKVLLADFNMLLLDEPNNYLDITSIRWLEHFLIAWQGELMLITHDRSFMDSVVTHTMGIHRRKVRKIEGDTEKLYAQIALEEEIYEKTRAQRRAQAQGDRRTSSPGSGPRPGWQGLVAVAHEDAGQDGEARQARDHCKTSTSRSR